ncbi:TIGR02680 family protein [Streptomyces sp. YPW6]|uniref:TIGR02680 family protein n=1 Tax=Streptomyces sp. YPW6 TaxID=2840373 RepID=UPI003EB76623
MTRLPTPRRTRWQPLRVGLVDLFHYDVDEFHFRDGRLLLRGNNGTGKSKVLALTLPFLLDGDLSPRRVEPDGDPGKRMEWNLLLGGEHPHSERLGYTWIEFGRLDDTTGEQHFRTLLCGLKAVSGRGIARHWFAVTRRRVDHGSSERTEETFRLLDATGTALSRDRLAEAVAGHGMVYDQAKGYRRAVDEALFGLGEQRYAALVDLLIQLRQPQLSKRPSEAALSRALTEALPPLDQAVIADVAEAFRSLDEEKDELASASAAERAASAFLEHYRRYARIASRRRARLPRTEHSRYERVQRDLAEDHERRTRAEEERAAAEEEIGSLAETGERLRAQETALREAPEMRDARDLEHAAEAVTRTRQAADRAREDRERADALHTKALGRLGAADNRLRTARALAEDAIAHTREQAAAGHVALPAAGLLSEPASRRAVEEATDRARRALDHVEGRLEASEQAAAAHRRAAGRLDEADTDLTLAAETHGEAEENAARVGRALLDDVRERARAWKELAYSDETGLLDELQEWTRRLDGPYPARLWATRAHTARSADLAGQAADAARATTELAERIAKARHELAALEAGTGRGPQPPPTRTPGLRETLPGAPLWRLVDFRHAVRAADRAGLEAALEASGLLDAWVLPDGSALAVDGHDLLLSPSNGPVSGSSLADVLCPAVDDGDGQAAAVDGTTVTRLLAAVGLDGGGGAATWVAPDGRFRVGALTGTWAKPAALYIGEGAREAARRARVAALGIELASLREESERLTARSEAIAARRRTLDAELSEVPDESSLTRAHARVSAAAETVRTARARYEGRATEATEAAERAERSAVELAEAAADLGLPADRAALVVVRHALGSLATALAALWPALREQGEAVRQVDDERAEAAEAEQRVVDLAQRAGEAAREVAAADQRHRTLRSTVGAAVAELQRRLAETAEAQRICDADQQRARQRHARADREASRAEGRIEQLEKDLAEAVDARAEAIAALQRFTATGLVAVALPEATVPASEEGHWAATPAIVFARAVESALASVDDTDAAWERVQRRLSEELKTLQDILSRHGHSASARMVEDGMVVDIVYQGRERAVPELAEALATEVGELTRILSAHEREILETHLITEVAGTL